MQLNGDTAKNTFLHTLCSDSCDAVLAARAIVSSMGSSQQLPVPRLKAEQVLSTGPDAANSSGVQCRQLPVPVQF